jgi:hypothetical protein
MNWFTYGQAASLPIHKATLETGYETNGCIISVNGQQIFFTREIQNVESKEFNLNFVSFVPPGAGSTTSNPSRRVWLAGVDLVSTADRLSG